MWYSGGEALLGLALILVLPGFFTARALFPEWRLLGPDPLLRLVETAALAVLLSVAYTILVGAVLLNTSGFSASWSDPVLEAALAVISVAAAVVAALRGGFARTPPAPRPLEPSGGEEGAWELVREREELARRERRVRHALRTAHDPREVDRLRDELAGLEAQIEGLKKAREAEYA